MHCVYSEEVSSRRKNVPLYLGVVQVHELGKVLLFVFLDSLFFFARNEVLQ